MPFASPHAGGGYSAPVAEQRDFPCGIVYCLSKRDCEDVCNALRACGVPTGAYYSDAPQKEWTQEEWGTRSGRDSLETGERYLPKAARELDVSFEELCWRILEQTL